jgi:rsbT co-antagonist protein RsbR
MQSLIRTESRVRFGLRLQLMLALGLLCILLTAIIATDFVSRSQILRIVQQAIGVDGRLSRLADNVAIQTLLCRRYEKDIFLNSDDAIARADYLAKWEAATVDLDRAIQAYSLLATDDAELVAQWRAASAVYYSAVVQIEQAISTGRITTPQMANAQMTPLKASIRGLTDSAVETARRRAIAAEQAEAMLEQSIATSTRQILLIAVLALLIAVVWSLFFPTWLMRPVAALHATADRMASGDMTARVALARADELGALALEFNHMAATVQQRTSDLEAQYRLANIARAEAEASRAEIAAQLATIEQQRAVIRDMSVPILPLTETTAVMPMVGDLDNERLAMAQQQALERLEQTPVRHLILDITGVPVIDSLVAQGMIQIVQAARLLGTEVVLVGVRPEVAQALVGLGIQLDGIVTRNSLQGGIAYTLGQA